MNFIENWFGLSPDGGNGSLEAVLLLLIVIGAAQLVAYVIRHSRLMRDKRLELS